MIHNVARSQIVIRRSLAYENLGGAGWARHVSLFLTRLYKYFRHLHIPCASRHWQETEGSWCRLAWDSWLPGLHSREGTRIAGISTCQTELLNHCDLCARYLRMRLLKPGQKHRTGKELSMSRRGGKTACEEKSLSSHIAARAAAPKQWTLMAEAPIRSVCWLCLIIFRYMFRLRFKPPLPDFPNLAEIHLRDEHQLHQYNLIRWQRPTGCVGITTA